MLESPLHQSQSPGEIQLIQVFYRTTAVVAPVLLCWNDHTGSSKGVKRQRSCDLGFHLPGTSLDLCGSCISFYRCQHLSSPSFVLCSSADTTVVPPYESGGDSPRQGCGGNLHQCQWLARPNSKELLSVVGPSAGKILPTPRGLDAVGCMWWERREMW